MHVALAVLVGRPRLDILGEGAVGELVLDEAARAGRADHDGRILPVRNPAGQHEEGEVGDMVVVQVRQEHRIDMAGIDVAADQLVRRTVAAVEHVVPAADGDQDGRVVAVRIGRGGGRAEHDDAHEASGKPVDLSEITSIFHISVYQAAGPDVTCKIHIDNAENREPADPCPMT